MQLNKIQIANLNQTDFQVESECEGDSEIAISAYLLSFSSEKSSITTALE